MTRAIDLIPAACRQRLNRRRRVRQWTAGYAAAILLLGTGAWVLFDARQSASATRDGLASKLQEAWDRNAEAQRLLKETEQLETAIARYNKLAWPVRAADVIDILGDVLPETVSLNKLALTPREEGKRGRKTSRSTKPGAEGVETTPRSMLVAELEGVAPSDVELARFVSGLDEHELFASVSLEYARGVEINERPARAYRIVAQINLNDHILFTEAAAANGGGDAP